MLAYVDSLGRVCTKCSQYKLFQEYHKHAGCKGGYYVYEEFV